MKLVSLSDGYIEFLRKRCPNVMDNKYEERNHTRKYIGVVLTINELNYFVPLSSPKKLTIYQAVQLGKVIYFVQESY